MAPRQAVTADGREAHDFWPGRPTYDSEEKNDESDKEDYERDYEKSTATASVRCETEETISSRQQRSDFLTRAFSRGEIFRTRARGARRPAPAASTLHWHDACPARPQLRPVGATTTWTPSYVSSPWSYASGACVSAQTATSAARPPVRPLLQFALLLLLFLALFRWVSCGCLLLLLSRAATEAWKRLSTTAAILPASVSFVPRNATPLRASNFFTVQLPATRTAAASAATAGEWAIAEDAAAAWTPPEADAATAACGLSYKLTARCQGGGTYPSASPGAGAASEGPLPTLLNCARNSCTVLPCSWAGASWLSGGTSTQLSL